METGEKKISAGVHIVLWPAVAVLAAIAVEAWRWQADRESARVLLRLTARAAMVMFIVWLAAPPRLAAARGRLMRWLAEQRLYLLLSFAVLHFIHLGMILASWYVGFLRSRVGGMAALLGGGLGYLLLFAMTVAAATPLEIRWREWLLGVGGAYLWLIFASGALGEALRGSALHIALSAGLLLALGLRLTHWARARGKQAQAASA